MEDEIRFWDYSYANLPEATAKFEAAKAALAESDREADYLRGVIARPNLGEGIKGKARNRLRGVAEGSLNRRRHLEYWKGIVECA